MKGKRKGKVVVLHLAARYPFAGVIWQLIHHLLGLRQIGFDVYYIEDHRAYVYDPTIESGSKDPSRNLKVLGGVLERYGFGDRWAFLDSAKEEYVGMSRERCMELFRDADMVVNLCGATEPREEHERSRCLVYLETDPGVMQLELARKIPTTVAFAKSHKLFFTYCYNIGAPDCLLPTGGVQWHPTRPPVNLDQWHPGVGAAEPRAFTTVGTWQNNGNDMVIAGETYYWSKHLNFRKALEVAARANQPIEIATNLEQRAGLRARDCGRIHDYAGGADVARYRCLSRVYQRLARRVHGREGHLREAAHGMVQRSHGVLPGGGTSGGDAADRV